MQGKVISFVLEGLKAIPAEVEVDISNGLPSFSIVGLPDAAVQESRERVRAAIRNSDLTFPLARITVNLAPAYIRKEGPLLDLPIAVALLAASGQLRSNTHTEKIFLGELSLSGTLKGGRGILPIVRRAKELGFQEFVVPEESAMEAGLTGGVTVYAVRELKQTVSFLQGDLELAPFKIENREALLQGEVPLGDFSEIKGQEGAKRALEVAAAGRHHILMLGSPGAGKTMLARRLIGIMPRLSFQEALEVSEIYSISGFLSDDLKIIGSRPFRAPHHSISYAGLVGGGNNPLPGEVSLAHNGVLFLDELPEFRRDALEALRQPLEEREVTITRLHGSARFPANFMLVAAMNPCPCGYALDPRRECHCSPREIHRYRSKVSGPLWDRFDIHLIVPPLTAEELTAPHGAPESPAMRQRVERCRSLQLERYSSWKILTNSQLSGAQLKRFCALENQERTFLRQAAERLHLTARSYDRILRLTRTIADLEGTEVIHLPHLAEALQYRGEE